jgi:hypothetical protein
MFQGYTLIREYSTDDLPLRGKPTSVPERDIGLAAMYIVAEAFEISKTLSYGVRN